MNVKTILSKNIKAGLAKNIKASLFCTVATVALLPINTFAQDNNENARSGTLEEVTVTARKITESLQTVPVAVTAISGDRLNKGYIMDLSDVASVAPNVVIDPAIGFSNAASISIRGISFQDIEKSFDPAVGVVIDGIYLGSNAQALLGNFDLDRIEVLRGPQGTLFGKNTTGGALNVSRVKPNGETGFEGSYSYGTQNSHQVNGAVNFPLSEKGLSMRIAANWDKSDGYLTNTVNGEKLSGKDLLHVRTALLYDADSNFDLYFNYDHIRDKGDTVGLRNATTPTQLFYWPGLLGINPLFPGFPTDTGPLDEVRSDFGNIADYTTNAASLEANWDGNDYTITSLTGYRHVDESVYSDFDAENAANFNSIRNQYHKQFTQELRLTSDWSEKYQLVAGIYYFWSEYELTQQIAMLTDWVPCGVLPGALITFGCTVEGTSGQTAKSIAGFAQVNVNLTPDLRLTAGGRYTHEEKDFYTTPMAFPVGLLGSTTANESWSEFTPRISLDYQASDNIFLFASYSRGFKSGGFNGRAQTITSIGPYNPETVDAFEVGMKTELLENRLRLNVTSFINKYDDMQVELIRTAEGGTAQETVVENAAKATLTGAEFELEALLNENLTIYANLGTLKAEYDNFTADLGLGLGVTDNTELKLRRAPKLVYSFGFNYHTILSNGGEFVLDGNYSWQDDLHTTTQNLDLGHRQAVGILNASATYKHSSGNWGLSIYGRNLTDEQYVADGIAIGGLVSLQTISAPMQGGIKLNVKF